MAGKTYWGIATAILPALTRAPTSRTVETSRCSSAPRTRGHTLISKEGVKGRLPAMRAGWFGIFTWYGMIPAQGLAVVLSCFC